MADIYSDNQIMLKVKAGDLDKLALLYERYKQMLFGFFYKMNRNTSVCEDMVQVVFVKVIKGKHQFTGDGEFSMWLFTIARNVGYDYFRKNKKIYDDIDNHHSIASTSDIEQELSDNEELGLLEQALDKLEHEQKEVLMMSRFEKLKYKQIAQILNVSEGAVKMKVKRALVELRRVYLKLENGGYDE